MKNQNQISTANNHRGSDCARGAKKIGIPESIQLDIPGVLAGRVFDQRGLLWFLTETIVHHTIKIDLALNEHYAGTSKAAPRSEKVRTRNCADRLRSLIEFRQVALLATNIYGNNPEVRDGENIRSPFAGIASTVVLSTSEAIEICCAFLYDHSKIISDRILKDSRRESDVDLAEALVVAEQVSYYNGFKTELDELAGGFLEPSTLVLQAWRIHEASLLSRLAA